MHLAERIDTHAHFLPDFYREALRENGHANPDGMPAIPHWDENEHLEFMKSAGITKSYLSISTPGVHHGDDAKAIKLARQCNEHAASLMQRHPEQFGSFASLPLPNVEAALEEIAHALDDLHADGFTLLTSYHGIYPGDERFERVFEELNRRKAKVFFHPTTSCMCIDGNSVPFVPLPYPRPMMEFFFDTTRVVVNLILSGTVERYPDITFLLPHAGAALPPLIDRFSAFSSLILGADGSVAERIQRLFRERFYYDLAGMSMPNQIHGTLRFAGPERLLYGSDYPYTPAKGVAGLSAAMDKEAKRIWSQETIEQVYAGNAKALFR